MSNKDLDARFYQRERDIRKNDKKASEQHGVVYTPVACVDFIKMLACWLAFVIVYDIDTGDCLYWYDEAKPHDIKPCGDETPFDYTKHKWIKPHGTEDQRGPYSPSRI